MNKSFEATVERGATARRTHTDGRQIYRAVATTPALDRYGEVVLPKGAVIESFMKNPVLLDSHDYRQSSVGHVVNIEVSKKQVVFDFVFSQDQRGQDLEAKFNAGDMNAFSIGFKPKEVVDIWNPMHKDAPDITEVKVKYPDGSGSVVNLSEYAQIPYRLYNNWELLEISTVSVPANPEALLMRAAEGIIRRVVADQPLMRSFIQDELAEKLEPVMELLKQFAEFEESEIKFEGAVPSHSTPIEQGSWSGAAARTALAKWASKEGTGKKEDMNWSKYSKGFAWFDSKAADNFGAYKLPHHTVKDGSLVAVWSGVTAAMAALMGARGGVDLNDKGAVYAHLAKHYKDFKKEPPALGKEYSDEELKAIEDELLVVEKEAVEDLPPSIDPPTNIEESGTVTEAAGDAAAGPNMMSKIVALLNQMNTKLDKLIGKESEDDEQTEAFESIEEHFIELQLKTEAIANMLEYGAKKEKEVKSEAKSVDPTEEIGDIDKDLVADLERLVALE